VRGIGLALHVMLLVEGLHDALGRAIAILNQENASTAPEPIEPDPNVAAKPICSSVEARISISSVSILSRARFLTRVISAMSSTGLVRKSSAPASSPFTRSDGWSSAVTMITGMCRVRGSALSRRQTSKPSMPGIITSSRTTSARSRAQT
jgi:hypothetical protein